MLINQPSNDYTLFQLPNGIVVIAKVKSDEGRYYECEEVKMIQPLPNGNIALSDTNFTKIYKSGLLEGPAPEDLMTQIRAAASGLSMPGQDMSIDLSKIKP